MKVGNIFPWPPQELGADIVNNILAGLEDIEGGEEAVDVTAFLWPEGDFTVAIITPEGAGFETVQKRCEELQTKRRKVKEQLAEWQIKHAAKMLVDAGTYICPCHLGEDPSCPLQLAINDAISRQFEANRDEAMKKMQEMTEQMSLMRLAVRQELNAKTAEHLSLVRVGVKQVLEEKETKQMCMTRLAARQAIEDILVSGQIFHLLFIGFNQFCRLFWAGVREILLPSKIKRG